MKDFAKSIVCNTKAEVAKVGNVAADITSDGNTWFVTTSDGKKKEFTSEREAEEYAKKVRTGNSKVGNGIKEDMKRAHPSDSIVDDVKASATYEAIVKQPWRVYDILGVGDSEIREYAFELIAKKYGVDYDTIYYAWLHSGYKLSDHKGPSNQEKAKRDFQKLGVSVSNTKTGNSRVGNFTISEGVKGKQELETKYKNNLRIAKEALSRISRKISGYENASNINWGHLGDIARIADLLSEI